MYPEKGYCVRRIIANFFRHPIFSTNKVAVEEVVGRVCKLIFSAKHNLRSGGSGKAVNVDR